MRKGIFTDKAPKAIGSYSHFKEPYPARNEVKATNLPKFAKVEIEVVITL